VSGREKGYLNCLIAKYEMSLVGSDFTMFQICPFVTERKPNFPAVIPVEISSAEPHLENYTLKREFIKPKHNF
jgi:hypothetical protein